MRSLARFPSSRAREDVGGIEDRLGFNRLDVAGRGIANREPGRGIRRDAHHPSVSAQHSCDDADELFEFTDSAGDFEREAVDGGIYYSCREDFRFF